MNHALRGTQKLKTEDKVHIQHSGDNPIGKIEDADIPGYASRFRMADKRRNDLPDRIRQNNRIAVDRHDNFRLRTQKSLVKGIAFSGILP